MDDLFGLLLRLHLLCIHTKSTVFFYLWAEFCQHVCAGHYCQVSMQYTITQSIFAVACNSYTAKFIGIVIYIPTPRILHTHSFPDVMLESYHVFPYSPIFFVIYLIITLYIISNVVRT